MSDQNLPLQFQFDLKEHGEKIVFSSPEFMRQWATNECGAWKWIEAAAGDRINEIWSLHQRFRDSLNNQAREWQNHKDNPDRLQQVFKSIANFFDESYIKKRILHSSSPDAVFLSKLRQEKGDQVAVWAYPVLLNARIRLDGTIQTTFFEGMLQALLYRQEIDWTATAHREVLDRLKNQYSGNISHQETRFKEIEKQNAALNQSFGETLAQQKQALDTLHKDQTDEVRKLREDHEKKLQAIESTYDQKLALQKPVEYWQTKERYHGTRSIRFGIAALSSGILLASGMAWLIHWTFKELGSDKNPQHWQVGLVLVGAFFTIWIIRILVRMFFSHVHLAADAAERRTMILTYLAMSREGSEFAPKDKQLILQHLFRTASDGLVKDDAAPPTPMEWLTRGR